MMICFQVVLILTAQCPVLDQTVGEYALMQLLDPNTCQGKPQAAGVKSGHHHLVRFISQHTQMLDKILLEYWYWRFESAYMTLYYQENNTASGDLHYTYDSLEWCWSICTFSNFVWPKVFLCRVVTLSVLQGNKSATQKQLFVAVNPSGGWRHSVFYNIFFFRGKNMDRNDHVIGTQLHLRHAKPPPTEVCEFMRQPLNIKE